MIICSDEKIVEKEVVETVQSSVLLSRQMWVMLFQKYNNKIEINGGKHIEA